MSLSRFLPWVNKGQQVSAESLPVALSSEQEALLAGGGTPNIISAANSTAVLLTGGATFTGAWEDVTNYTTVATSILGSLATDGTLYFDLSTDGGSTFTSVPSAIGDVTFAVPRILNVVETHVRIRYVNGTTAQTGTFSLQTKYSTTQNMELLSSIDGFVNGETPTTVVKSVNVGQVPSGGFYNERSSGVVFETQANLADTAFYDSGIIATAGYNQIETELFSDTNMTLVGIWYSDLAGTKTIRTFTRPYSSTEELAYFSAPVFGPYLRYVITNVSGGAATTNLHASLKFDTSAVSGQILGLSDFIPTNVVANLGRNVQVGLNPNGVYINSAAPGLDVNNTTEALLGISGVFTGTWSRVDLFGEIKVAMHSDVASASCLLQLSHDGVVIDTSLNLPPQLNTAGTWSFIHSLNPSLPYFRVVYTNNSTTAQTNFNLTTTLLVNSGSGFVSRTTQVLDKFTDARVIRQANDPTLDRNLGLLNYQKSARKFGKNNSVANGALETVWEGANLGGTLNYVFATTAQTVRIKAGGNAADTAAGLGTQSILITGLDQNWNNVTETLVTAGASASAATTALFIAINKVEVINVGTWGGSNIGLMRIENTTTLTELAYVPTGSGTTQQCVFSVPAGKTAYVTKIKVSVGLSDSADIALFHISSADDRTGPTYGAKHYEWGIEDYSGSRDFDLDTYLKFDEKNHIFMEAQRITGSGSAQVSCDFEMYLVNNA
jgi:hypothetical protein